MEIEILGEKPEKAENKELIGSQIKRMLEAAADLCERGYDLAAEKDLKQDEKDAIIEIIATAKGMKKVLGNLMGPYTDISEKDRKKIEDGADEFAKALTKGEAECEDEDKDEKKGGK